MDSTLVFIGGCEDRLDKREILREFVELAGGDKARVVAITAASCVPRKTGREYASVFASLGVDNYYAIHLSANHADRHEILSKLTEATGIFLTGGDQVRGLQFIMDKEIHDVIKGRYDNGATVAGTSAGAAMIADTMITGRVSESLPRPGCIQLRPGLGLIENLLVDTHFSQRGRFGRLAVAVARKPGFLGVGIDENTALFVKDGSAYVLGTGTVTLIDAKDVTYTDLEDGRPDKPITVSDLKVHMVAAHHSLDLTSLRIQPP